MYNRTHFKENDTPVLMEFLHEHPFAFLTGSFSDGKQVATQVPVLVEERDDKIFLQGHIIRKSDHHMAFLENPQALAVFTGAHCYVSASWYTNPQQGSTWNYMSMHLRGDIRFLGDEELKELLRKLSLRFEDNNSGSPTYFENIPDEYIQRMVPAITAFEMEVKEIENVFKLSQNRDRESYENIITQLEKLGGDSALIAGEMTKRIEKVFPLHEESGKRK